MRRDDDAADARTLRTPVDGSTQLVAAGRDAHAAPSTPALEMTGVVKRFGDTLATDGLDLAVERGETIALLGPSGCGKTTLLRMLAGFEQPTSGTIRIDGIDMTGKAPYERSVGILFQQYALFPHMSVADNVGYGLKRHGWPRNARRERIAEMLRLVHLEQMGERMPAQLSGGQQQRVALARALATQPALILLDEPLSALDAQLRHTLRLDLKRILRGVGATAILVTHDQEEAMVFAERIVVLNGGRIEQQGSARDLYMAPKTRFVAQFVGKSNWIADVQVQQGEPVCLRSRAGTAWRVGAAMAARLANASQHTFDLCIRPEHLARVSARPERGDRGDGWNRFEARVTEVLDVGADRHVSVTSADGDFTLWERTPPDLAPRVGDTVMLGVLPEHCLLVPSGLSAR